MSVVHAVDPSPDWNISSDMSGLTRKRSLSNAHSARGVSHGVTCSYGINKNYTSRVRLPPNHAMDAGKVPPGCRRTLQVESGRIQLLAVSELEAWAQLVCVRAQTPLAISTLLLLIVSLLRTTLR